MALSRPSPSAEARVAGIFYAITIVTAIFAEVAVRGNLVDLNDAAATARNILGAESLYRLGFAADLAAGASYLVVTLLLYDLLRPVGPRVALLSVFFSIVGVAVGAVNGLAHLAPLLVLKGAPYLASLGTPQLNALALLSLKLHVIGANIGLAFFGVYCILVGYLIFRSTFLPRVIGVLMVLAGCALLTHALAMTLAPAFASMASPYLLGIDGIGEIALTLWLLAMGVNVRNWERVSAASMQSATTT